MLKVKIISLITVLTFILLSICACSSSIEKIKKPTEKVIDEISTLDTNSSLREIERVQELYDALTESEKEEISNYDHFLHCKECVEYDNIVDRAFYLVKKELDSRLKNPQSLQIHSKTYAAYKYKETSTPKIEYICIEIDYSAQNGFGGYNRDVYSKTYYTTSDGKLMESYSSRYNLESRDTLERYYDPS